MEGSTIITIDREGIILSVDKNCCKMFGYDLDELVNQNVRRIIPAPYREQHDTYMSNYHRTQIPRIIGKSRVVEGQHKDGTIFAIRLSITKVGEGEGMVFVGMIDKLEDKSVAVTINNKGIIISCNHNVEELVGYKSDELIGNNISILVAPPHREKHDEYIQSYLGGAPPRVIGKARNVMAQHKNGGVFPICLQVEHIRMGPVDLFRGKLEKVESMEAMFTLNDEGIIVACNRHFVLPLFGYTNEELINQNISMLIPKIFQASSKTLGELSSHSLTHSVPLNSNGDHEETSDEPKPKKIKTEYSSVSSMIKENNGGCPVTPFKEKVPLKQHGGNTCPVTSLTSIKESTSGGGCPVTSLSSIKESTNGGYPVSSLSSIKESTSGGGCPVMPLTSIKESNGDGGCPVVSLDEESSGGCPVVSLSDHSRGGPPTFQLQLSEREKEIQTWKNSGIHLRDVRHKDGSTFPINLEIHPFPGADSTLYSVRIRRVQTQFNDQMSAKSIGDYWVAKTIGQGTYGKVKLGVHKRTKLQAAIKILSKREMGEVELDRARREIEILQHLKHPNIAQLYQTFETEDALHLIMEYGGRTLLSYVMEHGGLSEMESKKFFRMMVSAIDYCHKRNIIHRDIKHQNILLDNNGQVKIIDFGLSNFIEEGKLRSTFCGTPAYAAPEMILGKKYSGPEVDIWSLGVVLYSMITGGFPFENVCDILNGKFVDPKSTSQECCDLLKRMLKVDVNLRITLNEIINDKWLQNDNPIEPKIIECKILPSDDSSNK